MGVGDNKEKILKYKVIAPKMRKWFRLYPIILVLVTFFLSFFYFLYLQYKSKGYIDYRLTILITKLLIPFFLILIFINYLPSKLRFNINTTVSIYQNYIEFSIFFIKRKLSIQSIKKIEILDKHNIPKICKLFLETDNIKGIKIESKRTFWRRAETFLFKIENFDSFIEELKAKLPNKIYTLMDKNK